MKRISWLVAILLVASSPTSYGAIGKGTPTGIPNDVTSATATPDFGAGGTSKTDVSVSWTRVPSGDAEGGSPITGYQVVTYVSNEAGARVSSSTSGCSVSATSSSCIISGLAWATYYIFYVTATNSTGTSSALATNVVGGVNVASILTPGREQTISMENPPSPYIFGSADFQLTATASSGLPVTWSSSPNTVCTVDSSGVVHFLVADTNCTITATQNGASAGYKTVSASKTAKATISLTATATGASSLQGTAATLNGSFPYPGANVTPGFCLSRTNPGANPPTSCSLPTGVSIGTLSLGTVTASSATTVNAVASGLNANTTYYYWAIAHSGTNYASSTAVTFSTLAGPTVTPSGSFTGSVGVAMSNTFTATDGTAPYVAWDHGTLPPGLTFSTTTNTAVISGTPTSVGSVTTWVAVQDSEGINGSVSVTYTIGSAPSPSPSPSGGGGGGGGGGTPAVLPTPTPSPSVAPTQSAAPQPSPSAAPRPTQSPTPQPSPTQSRPQPLPTPGVTTHPTPQPTTVSPAPSHTAPAATPSTSPTSHPTPTSGTQTVGNGTISVIGGGEGKGGGSNSAGGINLDLHVTSKSELKIRITIRKEIP